MAYRRCGTWPLTSSHAALLRLLGGSCRCAGLVFLAGCSFIHCLHCHLYLHPLWRFLSSILCGFYLSIDFSPFTFRCRLLISSGSSPSGVSFLRRFRLPSSAPALFLFRLTASFGDTVRFSCLLLLVYGFCFLFGYLLLSYHSLSFARFSNYFFTQGPLCLLICLRSAWGVPSSSFPGSSFLLVLILFPCLSLLHPSVWRFRVSYATSPWVIFSTLFRGLPSLGFITSVCMDCFLLL